MSRASFIRRSFVGATAFLAIFLLVVGGLAATNHKSTEPEAIQPTTTEVTSTECTTTSTTTTTTTTELTTTTTTTEVETTVAWVNTAQIETQPYVVEVTTAVEPQPVEVDSSLPISEQDYILIANVISHEAGSSWISTYNRSQIVAAIMNRVADSRFPNTVDGVVHQQGQMFDVPYYRVDYSGIGYEPIDEAIDMYFSGEYDYGSANCWFGTGTENVFYTI